MDTKEEVDQPPLELLAPLVFDGYEGTNRQLPWELLQWPPNMFIQVDNYDQDDEPPPLIQLTTEEVNANLRSLTDDQKKILISLPRGHTHEEVDTRYMDIWNL